MTDEIEGELVEDGAEKPSEGRERLEGLLGASGTQLVLHAPELPMAVVDRMNEQARADYFEAIEQTDPRKGVVVEQQPRQQGRTAQRLSLRAHGEELSSAEKAVLAARRQKADPDRSLKKLPAGDNIYTNVKQVSITASVKDKHYDTVRIELGCGRVITVTGDWGTAFVTDSNDEKKA